MKKRAVLATNQTRRRFGWLLWIGAAAVGGGCVIPIEMRMANADWPQAVDRLGRYCGVGWGDGYHACQSSGARPLANLPPRSYASRRQPAPHDRRHRPTEVIQSSHQPIATASVLAGRIESQPWHDPAPVRTPLQHPPTAWQPAMSATPQPIELRPAANAPARLPVRNADPTQKPYHAVPNRHDATAAPPAAETRNRSEHQKARDAVEPLTDQEIKLFREFLKTAAEMSSELPRHKPDSKPPTPPTYDAAQDSNVDREQSEPESPESDPDVWPPADDPVETLAPPASLPRRKPEADDAARLRQPRRAVSPVLAKPQPSRSEPAREVEHYIRQPDAKVAEIPEWKFVRQPRR